MGFYNGTTGCSSRLQYFLENALLGVYWNMSSEFEEPNDEREIFMVSDDLSKLFEMSKPNWKERFYKIGLLLCYSHIELRLRLRLSCG